MSFLRVPAKFLRSTLQADRVVRPRLPSRTHLTRTSLRRSHFNNYHTNVWRKSNHFPALQSPRAPAGRRFNSTSAMARLEEDGLQVHITNEEMKLIIERAKEVWPGPPRIPPGWSCNWETWPYLLTLYWLSPYYLMLPQIEMIVNIRHRIPGETRPLLYSNEREAFVFTLVDDNTRFYAYMVAKQELRVFGGVKDEDALVQQLEAGLDLRSLPIVAVDKEGEEALQRILDRDEAVIPLLAQKFLDYTPDATHPWEENPDPEEHKFSDEEEIAELERLAGDMEKKLGNPKS
ncbi:hypothetical protein BD779DRAFT_1525629 [Infundibulicybe gibba]|nr:hypothetical protein BD779DRAFT_1525629 [Infundibulicybe gibba]